MNRALMLAFTIHLCVPLAAQDTTRTSPSDFIDVDVPPAVIHRVEPYYPEIAQRAGVEGKVWVKIWIDTAGIARDVLVLKSDAEIFNAPALEAARKFRFSPARIGNRPVDIWVSVPFKFALVAKSDTAKHAAPWYSPVEQRFFNVMTALLEGGTLSAETLMVFVTPHATAIVGGSQKRLTDVMEEQRAGKHSLEEGGRKIVTSESRALDVSDVGYMVFGTQPAGKKGKTHYHTVVFKRAADGTPRIIHWHAWHASR